MTRPESEGTSENKNPPSGGLSPPSSTPRGSSTPEDWFGSPKRLSDNPDHLGPR